MVRRKIDACKKEIFHVTDHAGRPARLLWSRHSPEQALIPLASMCFYFVHTDLNLDAFNFTDFSRDILEDCLDPARLDVFFIPGGTDADCVEHYHKELRSRGDVLEQIRGVQQAYKDFYNNHGYVHEERKKGRLPGLFGSHRHQFSNYHGLIFVYNGTTWDREDEGKKLSIVQFDPELTLEDFEPWERIPTLDPIETTRVRARRPRGGEDGFDGGSASKKYEDQGIWWWFWDMRSRRLWDGALCATGEATELGWTSW